MTLQPNMAMDRVANHLHLWLCHRFRLDTPCKAVIGFGRMLQDNWGRIVVEAHTLVVNPPQSLYPADP